jgi:hypothetical protein
VDLKSQLLVQRIRPLNYKDSWCDLSSIITESDATSPEGKSAVSKSDTQKGNVGKSGRARLSERAEIIVVDLVHNFGRAARIPVVEVLLALLALWGLVFTVSRSPSICTIASAAVTSQSPLSAWVSLPC